MKKVKTIVRKAGGIPQAAQLIGCSRQYVHMLVNGKRGARITADMQSRIDSAYRKL